MENEDKDYLVEHFKSIRFQYKISGIVDRRLLYLIHEIEDNWINDLFIETIDVAFHPLEAPIIQIIAAILKKKKLSTLHLSYCNLTTKLLAFLGEQLADQQNVLHQIIGDSICLKSCI